MTKTASMRDFRKVVRLGTNKVSIFCKILYTEGKLSISGVEGPMPYGNCKGSCGQIVMGYSEPGQVEKIVCAPGWTHEKIHEFFRAWNKWHLNDCQAASPAQMEALNEMPKPANDYYEAASAFLASRGLNPDPSYIHDGKPYMYGHAWLYKEVPAEVLAWFQALPDTDIVPAWV